MTRAGAIAGVLLLLAADAPKEDPNKEDLQKLQGTWIIASSSRDGRPLNDRGGRVVVTGDKLAVVAPNVKGEGDKIPFKLDATRKPKTLTLTPRNPKDNPVVGKIIYEIQGDLVRVVIAPPGGDPKEFTDKGQTLWELRRAKE